MMYVLVIWTIVATAGTQFTVYKERDWRPIGEFASLERCKEAAQALDKTPNNSRCLRK